MQISMIFIILGIMFLLFSAFAEDYYFSKKINVIKQAFGNLSREKLDTISPSNRTVVLYEEQKLRFVISDENFRPIYVTTKKHGDSKIEGKINNRIVKK